MVGNINEVKLNNRVVLLVQSYPALRLLYWLIENGQNVLVLTSKPHVKSVCESLVIPNILIQFSMPKNRLYFLIPNFLLRNIESFTASIISKKTLRRLTKYEKLDFIITIAGMDWVLLPVFLNLRRSFYYWDDSFYAKRHKITKPRLTLKVKNLILNLIYGSKFTLFTDEYMAFFPWIEEYRMPKNCLKLSGNINSAIPSLKYENDLKTNRWKIVFLGDYDFYDMSKKCNIAKLIRLIERLKDLYSDGVFYKSHPGSVSRSHETTFGANEIDSFIPIEIVGNSCEIILTLGSAAVLSLKETNAKVIGIGKLVDMCSDLFPMSEIQGLTHVENFAALQSVIEN